MTRNKDQLEGAPRKRRAHGRGPGIVWPNGVEQLYNISDMTRLRWEKAGRLPPRDAFVGGKPVGWRPATIEAAISGRSVP